MDRAHEKVVEAQFGPRAKAYVESAVHAQGPDLQALDAVVQQAAPARALDLGTGGGHVAYLLARHAIAVTAVDLSRDMLAAVAATQGIRLQHVKAHGALYNMAVTEFALADAIARATAAVDRSLVLLGLPGSQLIHAGERAGLRTTHVEGFAGL